MRRAGELEESCGAGLEMRGTRLLVFLLLLLAPLLLLLVEHSTWPPGHTAASHLDLVSSCPLACCSAASSSLRSWAIGELASSCAFRRLLPPKWGPSEAQVRRFRLGPSANWKAKRVCVCTRVCVWKSVCVCWGADLRRAHNLLWLVECAKWPRRRQLSAHCAGWGPRLVSVGLWEWKCLSRAGAC